MRLSSADPIENIPQSKQCAKDITLGSSIAIKVSRAALVPPFPIKTRARFEVRTHTIRSQVVGTVKKKLDKPKYLNLSSSHSATLWATRWQSICSNRLISELSHWLISTGTYSAKEPTMAVADQSKGSWKPHLLPSTGRFPRYAICCCKRVFDPTQHLSHPSTFKSPLRHCHHLETFVVVPELLNGPDFLR